MSTALDAMERSSGFAFKRSYSFCRNRLCDYTPTAPDRFTATLTTKQGDATTSTSQPGYASISSDFNQTFHQNDICPWIPSINIYKPGIYSGTYSFDWPAGPAYDRGINQFDNVWAQICINPDTSPGVPPDSQIPGANVLSWGVFASGVSPIERFDFQHGDSERNYGPHGRHFWPDSGSYAWPSGLYNFKGGLYSPTTGAVVLPIPAYNCSFRVWIRLTSLFNPATFSVTAQRLLPHAPFP